MPHSIQFRECCFVIHDDNTTCQSLTALTEKLFAKTDKSTIMQAETLQKGNQGPMKVCVWGRGGGNREIRHANLIRHVQKDLTSLPQV
jgi:hypothetical protein